MSNTLYLGIDTSNYTTSLALCDPDGKIVSQSRKLLEVAEGERGLRQSDAVFSHIKNLPTLLDPVRETIRKENASVAAVGYSGYPRDVEGSYMPCFLVGQCVGETVASALDVPAYVFSHQAGHVESARMNCGTSLDGKPFLAFHVSGGTTEVLFVEDGIPPVIRCVGGTKDLHAGQLIDRVGVRLGFGFPAGPRLEKAALEWEGKDPKVRVCVRGLSCHLSGLENQAQDLIKSGAGENEVARYVLCAVGETVVKLAENARREYGPCPILFAGGVMSNSLIRKRITDRLENVYFASPGYSSDNAAGIARLAMKMHRAKEGRE